MPAGLPLNQKAALTPLPEFREDLTPSLTLEELADLSNKAFRRRYAGRAFAWRGIGPLRRNLTLQEGEKIFPGKNHKQALRRSLRRRAFASRPFVGRLPTPRNLNARLIRPGVPPAHLPREGDWQALYGLCRKNTVALTLTCRSSVGFPFGGSCQRS